MVVTLFPVHEMTDQRVQTGKPSVVVNTPVLVNTPFSGFSAQVPPNIPHDFPFQI